MQNGMCHVTNGNVQALKTKFKGTMNNGSQVHNQEINGVAANGTHQESKGFHGSVCADGTYSDLLISVQNQIEEAIPLAQKLIEAAPALNNNGVFTIADFGSADGGTSMSLIYACVEHVRKVQGPDQPISVIYEDQSNNDFRPLFQRLEGLKAGAKTYLKSFENVFAVACGKSFYEQCVPDCTVHFTFSAFSMHYLSAKPCDITNGVHHSMITCPEEERKYRAQAERDWETILLNRAKELAPGGKMLMVNLVTNEQGEFLGYCKSAKTPLYPYITSLWRQMLDEKIITQEEFHSMAFVSYYRTKEDWQKPFMSKNSPVRKAGLSLVHFETRIDRFARYRDPFMNSESGAEGYAKWYIAMVRTWTQSGFYSALSDSRSEKEKMEIVDEVYNRWTVDVTLNPEAHGLEPIVYSFMAIEKKI